MNFTAEDYVEMLDMVIEKHQMLFYLVPEEDEETRHEIRRDLAVMSELRIQIIDHYDLVQHSMH
jgi:hypothetical protein